MYPSLYNHGGTCSLLKPQLSTVAACYSYWLRAGMAHKNLEKFRQVNTVHHRVKDSQASRTNNVILTAVLDACKEARIKREGGRGGGREREYHKFCDSVDVHVAIQYCK